jgi:histo-blood group ABO system transferase
MNVGILTIATGKYKKFVVPLYESIKDNFLRGHKKLYILFTDEPDEMKEMLRPLSIDAVIFKIERRGFPGDTLLRYHHFSNAKITLSLLGERAPDCLYYLDADMLISSEVGDEVLPTKKKKLVGVAHPGYWSRPGHSALGTPETNPLSKAFIPQDRWRLCYWAGGFNGGSFQDFMTMSETISYRVNQDLDRGIVAVWHDESHLNAYLSELQEGVKTLTPSYCYPESWSIPFVKRIVALDKNHAEVRS